MLGIDGERLGTEHRDVEALAVGAGEDEEPARTDQPGALREEETRREEMLDHLEGDEHVGALDLAADILDALLDHRDTAGTAGRRHFRRRLDGEDAAESA